MKKTHFAPTRGPNMMANILTTSLTLASLTILAHSSPADIHVINAKQPAGELIPSKQLALQTEPRDLIAAATCGYPGSPAHASVTFNTSVAVPGTAASYTCDNGYELLGPPRRICQANGTWSPVGIPFCVLNVGLGKAAMQSSTAGQGSAQKAVDGSTSPYFQASTCTMTDVEQSPWWYVNLLEPYLVQIVRIDFGTSCCANRQKATIAVRVGNNRPDLGNNPLCNRYHGFIEEGKPLFLPCTRPAPGAFVSVHLESPSGSSLSICETFIYTDHALSIEQCPSFRDQPLGSTATYNGKCYLFHNNQALTFDGARKYCESRGGSLVDETSPALQGFLSWELYRRHRNDQLMGQYWLGAVRDHRQPSNWKWINGKDVQISFWNSLASQSNCSRFDGSKGWLWSDTDCNLQLNFICQYRPLSCGKPEKPTNSTLTTKNVDNGTVIEYQCAPGNLLMGPKSRACLPTGFFSEFAPKCKYLDCQPPAQIQNGNYRLLNGTTSYTSLVNYYCHDGYQLYGKAALTCDVDERWNGPPPRCEPLLCSAPVPPTNGYVTLSSNLTIPGTQATYDCWPGYELVGDKLLTCLTSGSWDQSFPYCRERRSLPATPTAAPSPPPRTRVPQTKPQAAPGAVQFPQTQTQTQAQQPSWSNRSPSSTTTIGTTISQQPAGSQSQASLNGLAGQYMQNSAPSQLVTPVASQPPPLPAPEVTPMAPSDGQPLATGEQQLAKRPSQPSNSVSQFVVPAETPATGSGGLQPPMRASVASTMNPPTSTQFAATVSSQATGSSSTTSANRFSMGQSSLGTRFPSTAADVFPETGPPHAASNSISVHSSGAGFTPTTLMSHTHQPSASSPSSGRHHHAGHHHGQFNQSSILASLGAAAPRSPNSMNSAKYSLDGIIAVAIFGGFIFLGVIITIIVIIIRRKGSHSSSIDAQTISTYDPNGEHNGLYRNYQQAWENLRFASPGSQPKSSGLGGVGASLMGVGPAVGLKQLGPHHIHHAHQLQGHHNLAMSGASSTSSTGSQSGSSLGHRAGMGGGTSSDSGPSGPIDPLLRSHHAHLGRGHHRVPSLSGGQQLRLRHPSGSEHHAGHHHHHHHHHEMDESDSDGEQGVLSSDETPGVAFGARGHEHPATAAPGEEFRDSNELTINADTALIQTGVGHRHHAHLHHAHHHRGHHPASSATSSQHQRLVSSSTPSTSSHSSRASPPSDEHSLEQLAYGNGWHPNGKQQPAGSGQQVAGLHTSSSSSQRNSTGSGASILGQQPATRY